MLYREAGQFKTTYAADQQLFPIRQDRIGVIALLLVAFFAVPLLASETAHYSEGRGCLLDKWND